MSLTGNWITTTIAANTTSSAIDLLRDYDLIEIVMPTLPTSCDLSLAVARTDTEVTYPALGNITQTVGTGGYTEVFYMGGFRYIKLVSSVSQSGTNTFYVRGIAL